MVSVVIFETLHDSAQRGELLLIAGGFCHWHLRRDGQLTIREVISTRPGAGSEMLGQLKAVTGAESLFAKCPVELAANSWYMRRGFELEGQETTKTGRVLNLWRLKLSPTLTQELQPLLPFQLPLSLPVPTQENRSRVAQLV